MTGPDNAASRHHGRTSIPSEEELHAAIERGAVASLVDDLMAEACHRGNADASESLLVAGAVSDLIRGPRASTLAYGREAVRQAADTSIRDSDHESANELLSAAWSFLSRLPRRELNVKWLRQLPREDRSFLYVRSLEDVLAAPTLEEAALRLSAILRAVQESEPRRALFLEAAAWTPGSSALAMTQIALDASGEEAEQARPFWMRILERIHSAGAQIPFRPPSDPGPLGWAELSRSLPEEPEALLAAWIARPHWLRAIQQGGTKSASIKAALVRHLGTSPLRADPMHHTADPLHHNTDSMLDPVDMESRDVQRTQQRIDSMQDRVTPTHSQPGPLQGEAPSDDAPWTNWTREREAGRAHRVLESLRSGRPIPFLALSGLCAMRSVPPLIDARIVERTYGALERTP